MVGHYCRQSLRILPTLCFIIPSDLPPGDAALTYLESPALRLGGEACLEFWYQTAPAASESSGLRVLLKENTQGPLQIWTTSPGRQEGGGAWRHVSLPVAASETSIQVKLDVEDDGLWWLGEVSSQVPRSNLCVGPLFEHSLIELPNSWFLCNPC